MFELVDYILKLQAIKRGLRKKAPPRFTYSPKNDYYTTTLNNEEVGQSVLVEEITGSLIKGKKWENGKFSIETQISKNDLPSWKLESSRFYGYTRHDYRSVQNFWFNEIFFIPQVLWLKNLVSQAYYNARLRFRQDRIEVLRRIVELDLEERQRNNALLHTPNGFVA